jgi:hypothetical protein
MDGKQDLKQLESLKKGAAPKIRMRVVIEAMQELARRKREAEKVESDPKP